MKKRSLFFIILTIIGVTLFAVLVYQIGWEKIKEIFVVFTWWQFAILVGSFFVWLFFITRSTLVIMKSFGRELAFKDMFPLACIAFSIGYITPVPYTGGEPVQIYLMYKRLHVPVSLGTSSMILEKVTRQSISLMVIIAGVILSLITIPMPWLTQLIILGLIGFLLFALWAFFAKSISGEGFLHYTIRFFHLQKRKFVTKPKCARVIENTDHSMTNFLTGHGRAFWTAMGYATLATAVMVLQIVLVLHFMGYSPSLTNILLLYMVTNLITLLPTPAMLGTYEAGSMILFALKGIGAGFGLVFSLLMRIATTAAILPGLFLLPYYGLTIREAVVNGKVLRKKGEEPVPINHANLNKTPLDHIQKILLDNNNSHHENK
jgi:glycosyltransferase 2 family protein